MRSPARLSVQGLLALLSLLSGHAALAGVCDDVARLQNAGELDSQLMARQAEPQFDREPFASLASAFVGQFDADGDSRIDYVFAEGSDRGVQLYDAAGAKLPIARDPELDSRRELYRWGEFRGILRRGNQAYWIWQGHQALGFVSIVTQPPERRERLVCEFVSQPAPRRRLASGAAPVCAAAESGGIEPIPFEPSAPGADAVAGTDGLRNPRLARVDIDNDGVDEILQTGMKPAPRGADCLYQVLRLPRDDAGESRARPGLNAVLEGLSGNCDAELTPFRFLGSSYVRVTRGDAATLHQDISVIRIEDGAPREICAIEVRPIFVPLSPYERFIRESRELSVDPWDAALHSPGVAKVELLLDNGWKPDSESGRDSPLQRAIFMDRADLVDLLLVRGADPNRRDSTTQHPVERALWLERPEMAERLYAGGANYELKEDDIVRGLEGDSQIDWWPLVLRFAKARQGIPEAIVLAVVSHRSAMLDRLLDSGFSAYPGGREWHAGRPLAVPWRIAAITRDQPEMQAKLVRLFERGKLRYQTNDIAYYGTVARHWVALRGRGSSLPIDDFLSFATAACVSFFAADCGSPELLAKSAEWVRTLGGDCPSADWAATADRAACAVATFYRNGARPNAEMLALTTWGVEAEDSGFPLQLSKLLELHRLKHNGARSDRRP